MRVKQWCAVDFELEMEVEKEMVIPGGGAAVSVPVSATEMPSALSFMAAGVLAEIHRVFNRIEQSNGEDPAKVILREVMLAREKSIVVLGVGREGLMMRAFAMRLFHLGLRAHVLGDMTTPAIGSGDLLIASAGPGTFSSVDAMITTAKRSGATVLVITAQPDGPAGKLGDVLACLPAQTMADDNPYPSHKHHLEYEGGESLQKEKPGDGRTSIAFEKHTTVAVGGGGKEGDRRESSAALLPKPGISTVGKLSAKADKGIPKTLKVDSEVTAKEETKPAAARKQSSVSAKRASLERGKSLVAFSDQKSEPILEAPPFESSYICCKNQNQILPMGSVYEGALFILFEIVVYSLREKLGETLESMRKRHTNLE